MVKHIKFLLLVIFLAGCTSEVSKTSVSNPVEYSTSVGCILGGDINSPKQLCISSSGGGTSIFTLDLNETDLCMGLPHCTYKETDFHRLYGGKPLCWGNKTADNGTILEICSGNMTHWNAVYPIKECVSSIKMARDSDSGYPQNEPYCPGIIGANMPKNESNYPIYSEDGRYKGYHCGAYTVRECKILTNVPLNETR